MFHLSPTSNAAIKAGGAYALGVFVIGCGLGAARTLWLVPRVGATVAVLLESPVILTFSWFVARGCVTHFSVAGTPASRIKMGAIALATLIAFELALADIVFHRPASEFVAEYRSIPGMLGLVAQVLFATFPYLQISHRNVRSGRNDAVSTWIPR